MAALTYYNNLLKKLKEIQTDEDLQEYIDKIENKIADMESKPYKTSKEVFDWFARYMFIRRENKRLIAEIDSLKEKIKQLN